MSRWRDDYHYYPKTSPKPVQGGIKAVSQRGDFGTSWWGKRWSQILDGYGLGARLTRGRTYARNGQVISIDIDKGIVTAKVQGSRATPYKVVIKMVTITAPTWEKIIAVLADEARFLAKLLAGEMPNEIEEVFKKVGVDLFPSQAQDLSTDCSCPDWSNPCKHIAAVYLLLGEVFDKDPFLIFKLRGMERVDLLAAFNSSNTPTSHMTQTTPPGEPILPDPDIFWRGQNMPQNLFDSVNMPSVDAALLKRLGPIPLWRGEGKLAETLGVIYPLAAKHGMDIYIGSITSPANDKE